MAKEEVIFPSNIRSIRVAKGMKMTELARRAKLSLSAISKIEKGVRRLNQKQLLNICNILDCKLSDIFIKETDEVAQEWQSEIRGRLADNESSGLKIFGSGLRRIRQKSGKTIAQAAKDAKMTLSVYHKIEVGQRELYQDEVEPLVKSFGYNTESFFDEIASMYKAGDLNKQISKVKERVKSVLEPGNPSSNIDLPGSLYGAKLYDSARRKLSPVLGKPDGKGILFKKSNKTMVIAPVNLEGRKGIYAVIPNTKRMNGMIPEKSYMFADAESVVQPGDLAIFIDAKFDTMDIDSSAIAHVALAQEDSKGKMFGRISSPEEKITAETIHKIVMIVME